MKRLFTAAMLLVITTISANAQLVINELMQSNVECIMDDIHEFPDSWVELYNSGSTAVNLKDYKIGTKDKANKAWQLPNKTVPAGGYVIIYCDKEEKGLHTSFRLESDKVGNLYLFQGSNIVNSVTGIPIMPAPDVAYGRKTTDDGDIWGYELTPTPGAANSGGLVAADHILGAPEFGRKGFVSNSAFEFDLTLSLPDKAPEGAVIRYTMDGSEPTTSSTQYTAPIRIKTTNTNNNRAKVIRAKVFCNGWLSPMSTAQSYIFHPRTMTVPIFSVQTNDLYLNGADSLGLFKYNTKKEDKKTCDWRRPINIEMFTKEGEGSKIIFNQLGETRIQGGQSRANDLKSMVFYANKRFGPNNKRFDYEFFPDQKPGVTEFKSFSLRDGGNDFSDLYFRDLIIQRTMGENTDIDWQAGHTAVLYINGEYMGMLNIRERSNEDNIESNYGIEDMDMVEISHEKVNNVDQFIEEYKGSEDSTFYKAFKDFYSEMKENEEEYVIHTLEEYEQWLDVSEYLNVVIMNLFYGNIDWPGNNTVFWRPNDDDEDSGLPKRFRVIVKDTDFGLGLYGRKPDYNTIKMLYDQSYDSGNAWAFTEPATRLIQNMLKDPGILNLFIDKSCVFMGDFMNATGTGEIIDLIKDEAMEEFVAHRVKYNKNNHNENYNRTDITNKFNDAKKWLTGYTEQGWGYSTTYKPRTDYFLDFIKEQFKQHLNGGNNNVNIIPIPVTINKEVTAENMPDEVYVNGIKLTKSVFDGKLFLNRNITLEGKNNIENDLSVTGWEFKTTNNGVTETETFDGATYSFTVPSCTKLQINAVKVQKPFVEIGIREAVSFSSKLPLDFTGLPIEAYIVTAKNGNKFMKKQVFKVPAKTGLVLEGAEGTYKIPVACANASFDDVSDNMLIATADGPFTVPDNNNVYYGLFYSYDQQKVGFQKKSVGYTFPQGKSYLCLTQHQAKEMTELFYDGIIDGIATDIQGANNNTWTDGQIYNLNGQRVDKNYNGVIIVNGKKVINNRK